MIYAVFSGDILWERDLRYPIVALYLLQQDGLHKLPFTIIGKETMDNLIKVSFSLFEFSFLFTFLSLLELGILYEL